MPYTKPSKTLNNRVIQGIIANTLEKSSKYVSKRGSENGDRNRFNVCK